MRGVREWLDSLSTGACDEPAFLAAVNELVQKAPDDGWELLSLIDQYFRRGRIGADSYRNLKAHVQVLLMGPAERIDMSMPRTRAAAAPEPSRPPERPVPVDAEAAVSEEIAATEPRTVAVGDVLRDRYRIQALLAQSGNGTLFEALDSYRLDLSTDGKKVAIKVLHPAVMQRLERLVELRREFQQLQSLSHPNIVRVHEYDRDGDIGFFTLEYLGGAPLRRVLSARAEAPLARPYALAIIRDVSAALAHAHARGVVHGNLDPENIFITNDGEIRVLDFGSVRSTQRDPTFASCQVLESAPADTRDDSYSFSCVAYVLLTGKHPFQQHTAVRARSLRLTPSRPAGLSRQQWQSLRAGLAFARDQRPADIQVLRKPFISDAAEEHLPALQALNVARPARPSAMRWATAGLAFVLVAGAWVAIREVDSIRLGADALTAQVRTMVASAGDYIGRLGTRPPLIAGVGDHTDAVSPEAPPPTSADSSARSTAPASPSAPPPAPAESTARSTTPAAAAAPTPTPTIAPAVVPHVTQSIPPARANASALANVPAEHHAVAAPAATPVATRPRIELAADSIEVAADEPTARVVVRRSGSLRGNVSFNWWTESGTAKPGQDFSPVKSQVEQIDDGKNSVSLLIPVTADRARKASKSFYVVIDEASPGAALGPRTLTMITLPAAE
jgi:serine/threonine protein kinase